MAERPDSNPAWLTGSALALAGMAFSAGDHYHGFTPKYIDFKIYTNLFSGQRSQCITVGTSPVVQGYSVDTEILAVNASDTDPNTKNKYAKVSDDINGGLNRYSKARFFLENGIGDGGEVKIRIAVYNSDPNLNKEHFYVYTSLVLGVTTEAGCFTDPEAGNAYVDHVESVYIRRAMEHPNSRANRGSHYFGEIG